LIFTKEKHKQTLITVCDEDFKHVQFWLVGFEVTLDEIERRQCMKEVQA